MRSTQHRRSRLTQSLCISTSSHTVDYSLLYRYRDQQTPLLSQPTCCISSMMAWGKSSVCQMYLQIKWSRILQQNMCFASSTLQIMLAMIHDSGIISKSYFTAFSLDFTRVYVSRNIIEMLTKSLTMMIYLVSVGLFYEQNHHQVQGFIKNKVTIVIMK